MKRHITFVAATLLLGCSSPASDLERERDMMEQAGAGKAELCVQDRKIEGAYLKAGNQKAYADKRMAAEMTCLQSEIDASRP